MFIRVEVMQWDRTPYQEGARLGRDRHGHSATLADWVNDEHRAAITQALVQGSQQFEQEFGVGVTIATPCNGVVSYIAALDEC